jgi:type II restriction enzyme
MKKLTIYNDLVNSSNTDDVFDYLVSTLKPSILLWSYFVNWGKVFENTKIIEVSLNTLNYLLGKKDFDNEFRQLLRSQPQLASIIPALIVRNGESSSNFKILADYKQKRFVYKDYDFSKPVLKDDDIEKYLEFVIESGLKNLFLADKVKNLVDYMIGVEAGLDSNARKNRAGQTMEDIVEYFIDDYCNRNHFAYLRQANAKKILQKFGVVVPVDKSSRRYDFVVNAGKELIIFETNFYSGGGSKLKSTAGEYRNLFDTLNQQFKFVWITDGQGWLTARNSLYETFIHNDYVFNLSMLESGILDRIKI